MAIGSLLWLATRSRGRAPLRMIGGGLLATAVVGSFAAYWEATKAYDTGEWVLLQRELQAREAELENYVRAHPGLSTQQLVAGFLATEQRRTNVFRFTDPNVPPLHFKVSDWRDTVPRVVVGFGCSNNVLFDSATMRIQHLD